MEYNETIATAIEKLASQDVAGFQNDIQDILAAKMNDALDIRRMEVAGSMLTPSQVTTNSNEAEIENDSDYE
jgi:hypothetical protein